MKNYRFICLHAFLVGASLAITRAADEVVGPWNLTVLKRAPTMRWLEPTGPIRALLYTSEQFRGEATEVFAFYASPATLDEAKPLGKFPGVILIHGGGGTAFAEWVHLWAKRGYAALAMDLAGSRPPSPVYDPSGNPVRNQANAKETRSRLAHGGPDHGHAEKFDSIGGDVSNHWPYHAAASVIRAHSLLRTFPEVDANHTAVTGISWGGYATCLVASLDDRFKAAVPVYGCGFLFEGESVQKPFIDKLADQRAAWIQAYDPASLLPRCRVPILLVNGTNDIHYPLDSYQKTFDVVPGPKQLRIEVKMPHGHSAGWAPQEIGWFIDAACRDGPALPVPGKITTTDATLQLPFTSAIPLRSASLHFTTETGLRSQRTWQALPAAIHAGVITAPKPPAEANTWFIALTDQRGAMVTTAVHFQP